MGFFALVGFAIGTFKFPDIGTTKMAKYWGGEQIDEIALRYLSFKKHKKIYSYAVPREEPNYLAPTSQLLDLFNLQGKSETNGSLVDNIVNKNTNQKNKGVK